MAVNSSSSNGSRLHSSFFSIRNVETCLISAPSSYIFISFNLTYIFLLLPLSIPILLHGLHQWRLKKKVSHSDSFTYHAIIIELIRVFGCVLGCFGFYMTHLITLLAGFFLLGFTWFGELFFHALTCVDRYLAVVHPITYLSLRNKKGIRIRNISIAGVWLFSVVGMVFWMFPGVFTTLNFSLLMLSFLITSYCSLSVLCILIRPGPGEQGGKREWVDQSKRRAFITIVAILVVLLVRFALSLFWAIALLTGMGGTCLTLTCGLWFGVPASLVLPLLFLYKEGRQMFCKKNPQ